MENYHKHTFASNIWGFYDSAVNYEDYAKRAVELGQKTLSSVEHGWQGKYHTCWETAKKYGLKFIFGTEAYWVKDRMEKDRRNNHIILLARTEAGRRAINDVLSEANETGYYFRPRVDLPLLLSLPPNDVVVTSACIGFWNYGDEETEPILQQLADHFHSNFYLEIQYHDFPGQVTLNQKIKNWSSRYGAEMIVGLDSHYITPEQAEERDNLLLLNKVHYADEDHFYMDYPDEDTTLKRFLTQGVFSKEQICRAMENTNVVLDFEDYTVQNPVFSKDVKLPTLFDGEHSIDGIPLPKLSIDERKKCYSRLITKKFKEYIEHVPEERREEYYQGVKEEVNVYKNTNMVDYPMIDYEIVKKALHNGGYITSTGRGSAVGFLTNTLCGFSKVDRFTSPIKLYPERFISESRILETKSLPDLDLNCGNPEIFAKAQEEVMGQNHAYPMIAFGTARKPAAFKMYARTQKLDFAVANAISEQIKQYDEALKYAENEDEKNEIDIYDYVDKQYHSYLDASKKYWGIITDKKQAPCSYLLYAGDIRREIGLIRCKSDTTKKECITTVIDGQVAENYKFLKNDLLKVDVVLLINAVYQRIGIPPHTVEELRELVKNDPKVWDLYANGLTMGINQCEKKSTTQKLMTYQPKNISELSAFIAAIRPGFKSMYAQFERREPFSYGIPALDNLIQTEEFPQSYILYQEQAMNTLHYAGFPMDECYGIIKAIAKKHPELVKPLEERFLQGFQSRIMQEEKMTESAALSISQKVWQIISDSCNYSFNASHAYCMALDSLYCAYLKAHYPYEFYEVFLQMYSDKGNKNKVAAFKAEMTQGFQIQEGAYRFGLDNRRFVADAAHQTIYPSLLSIKGMSQTAANDLYRIAKEHPHIDFCDLWTILKQTKSLDSAKLNTLIDIDYFHDFGTVKKIRHFVAASDYLSDRSSFSKTSIPPKYLPFITRHARETEKQWTEFDSAPALREFWDTLEDEAMSVPEQLQIEKEHFGYLRTSFPDFLPDYYFVESCECKYKNPVLTLCRLCDRAEETVKVKRAAYDKMPIYEGNVIKSIQRSKEGKWKKDANGEWVQDDEKKEIILQKWSFVQ